jgi:hypothetical protein
VVSYARKEPGLLSWNVSTLLNRMMAVRQMLQLPPELALSLLAFNRPLLNGLQHLPQKLQVLQQVLGVTGDRRGSTQAYVLEDAQHSQDCYCGRRCGGTDTASQQHAACIDSRMEMNAALRVAAD